MPKKRVVLAVHGGAGIILRSELKPELEEQYRSALKDALRAGYAVLTRNKEEDANESKVAVAAAEAAVRSMEDCHLFNAGKGSVFAHDGKIRMDASIMTCLFDGECTVDDDYTDNEKITVEARATLSRTSSSPSWICCRCQQCQEPNFFGKGSDGTHTTCYAHW